jgi:hypothetical protein
MQLFFSPQRWQRRSPTEQLRIREEEERRFAAACEPRFQHTPTEKERLVFDFGVPTVYGWPSVGGRLSKQVDAVELIHLGLDRFQEAWRAEDPADEDKFCQKLRRLGAIWWADDSDWVHIAAGGRGTPENRAKFNTEIQTGWPSSGGVWVHKRNKKRRIADREMLKHVARSSMAVNMDERLLCWRRWARSFFRIRKTAMTYAGIQ